MKNCSLVRQPAGKARQAFHLLCAFAFLLTTCFAQAQEAETKSPMSPPEFRQVLSDLGGYLDAHRNTAMRPQMEGLTDEQVGIFLRATPDPYGLQKAVAALKQNDAEHPGKSMNSSRFAGRQGNAPNENSYNPLVPGGATYPNCPYNTIIDTASGAACNPAYPDPTNTSWQVLVEPLVPFGAFSPTDYPDIATQSCSLTVQSNLQLAYDILSGAVLVATPICSAIPLGGYVCWAAVAVVSLGAAITNGLYGDCISQGANVSGAEGDAAFHNTVTIYNELNAANNQLTNQINGVSSQITTLSTQLGTDTTTITTDLTADTSNITTAISNLSTQLATDNNQITSEFNATDNQITTDFNTLNANLTALFNKLTAQLTQFTQLSSAQQFQVMKLLLEPDTSKIIHPLMLTCTGSNCPNVLAACSKQSDGTCFWGHVGPLP